MQINEDFDNKLAKLSTQDEYYEAKNRLEIERSKQLDAVETLSKKRVKNNKKRSLKEMDQLVKDLEECKNTKTVHEFHACCTASIKGIGLKSIIK